VLLKIPPYQNVLLHYLVCYTFSKIAPTEACINCGKCDHGRRAGTKSATNSSFNTPSGTSCCRTNYFFHGASVIFVDLEFKSTKHDFYISYHGRCVPHATSLHGSTYLSKSRLWLSAHKTRYSKDGISKNIYTIFDYSNRVSQGSVVTR